MTRTLAPFVIVDAPPVTPPLHGLIASASNQPAPGDEHWELGYGFVPENCATVLRWGAECLSDGDTVPGFNTDNSFGDAPDNDGFVEVHPFTLYVPFECSTIGMATRSDEQRVLRQVEAGSSKALEYQFWKNDLAIPGSFSLVGSTPNVMADDPGEDSGVINPGTIGAPTPVRPDWALAALQQSLANCGLGSRGMIHAPTFLASLWESHAYFEKDGQRLVTRVRGDVLVCGSGYPGTGPTGNALATPPAGTTWAYATGMVQTRLGEPRIDADGPSETVNRKNNRVTVFGTRTVSAAVDGCCVYAVLVDIS